MRARQRTLEAHIERRFPALYDTRHAATGIGRALWPLLMPLIFALLAGLVALLDLHLPAIHLPRTRFHPDTRFSRRGDRLLA